MQPTPRTRRKKPEVKEEWGTIFGGLLFSIWVMSPGNRRVCRLFSVGFSQVPLRFEKFDIRLQYASVGESLPRRRRLSHRTLEAHMSVDYFSTLRHRKYANFSRREAPAVFAFWVRRLFSLLVLASSIAGIARSGCASPDDSDVSAVRQLFQSYVLAFNSADFDALSDMWSENALHIDHATGERTTGREQIINDMKEAVTANPSLRLSGVISHLTLLDDGLMSVQGEIALTRTDEAPAIYRFTSIAKRSESQWRLKLVEEFPVLEGSGPSVSLKGLAWLVGTWETDGDAKVTSTIRPAIGGAFLVRSYESTDEEGNQEQSVEIIGVDPRSQTIIMWSFHGDGSFGSGVVSQEGDLWRIKSAQTLADGRSASGTFVVMKIDDHTLSVQLVAHEIDGEPQPTAEPTTMKRVVSELPQ
jgi:uncharacterized protein (TIGR02246 family)